MSEIEGAKEEKNQSRTGSHGPIRRGYGVPPYPPHPSLTARLMNAHIQMPKLTERRREGLAEITRAPASITLSR